MAKKREKKSVDNWVPFDLKPDKNFRMSKQTKRFMALGKWKTDEERNAYKRAMINAQLSEEVAKRQSIKRDREDVSA
jgi:hypothetical protein